MFKTEKYTVDTPIITIVSTEGAQRLINARAITYVSGGEEKTTWRGKVQNVENVVDVELFNGKVKKFYFPDPEQAEAFLRAVSVAVMSVR